MQEIVEFRTVTTDDEATRLLTEKRTDQTYWSIFQPPVYLTTGMAIGFVRVRQQPKILRPRLVGSGVQ